MHLDWKNKCCENDNSTKGICRFNVIPNEFLTIFFAQIEKLSGNSIRTTKGQGK